MTALADARIGDVWRHTRLYRELATFDRAASWYERAFGLAVLHRRPHVLEALARQRLMVRERVAAGEVRIGAGGLQKLGERIVERLERTPDRARDVLLVSRRFGWGSGK